MYKNLRIKIQVLPLFVLFITRHSVERAVLMSHSHALNVSGDFPSDRVLSGSGGFYLEGEKKNEVII